MSEKLKCRWTGGCTTILSSYNKTVLCGVHQRLEDKRLLKLKTEELMARSTRVLFNVRKRGLPAITNHSLVSVEEELTVEKILEIVCTLYNISKDDLLNHRRYQKVAIPRQVAAYLLRTDLKRSFPEIASDLKRLNHTTIIHACKKVEKLLTNSPGFRENVNLIRSKYINSVSL